MLGSVSAVQHYNVISKIITTLRGRVFRIPLVGYFDVDAGIEKNRFGGSALEAIEFMNHSFGFQKRAPKSRWLNKRNPWGQLSSYPHHGKLLNFFQIHAVGRVMRYTSPMRNKQLYSGSRYGKLSTQFL